MSRKCHFLIFNLVFFTVLGLIFISGYLRPVPDIEASQANQSGVSQPAGSCLFCP